MQGAEELPSEEAAGMVRASRRQKGEPVRKRSEGPGSSPGRGATDPQGKGQARANPVGWGATAGMSVNKGVDELNEG